MSFGSNKSVVSRGFDKSLKNSFTSSLEIRCLRPLLATFSTGTEAVTDLSRSLD